MNKTVRFIVEIDTADKITTDEIEYELVEL